MEISIRQEKFHLLPERVLFWPRKKRLVVADLHLGKAEVFQKQGLWLPSQAQQDDLQVLSKLIKKTEAQEILFLGDLVHHVNSVKGSIENLFFKWTNKLGARVIVTLGNHDRGLDQRWPPSWSEIERVSFIEDFGFRFQHDLPESSLATDPFLFVGHLHPVVVLKDGADRLRLPCFSVGERYCTLPAFSRLAGGFEVKPSQEQHLYAVTPDRVWPLQK